MWEVPEQKGLEGMKEEGREWIHGLLLFSRWIWQIFARSAKQKKEERGRDRSVRIANR